MEKTGERMGMEMEMGKTQLNNAAKFGDVEYLKKVVASEPNHFPTLYSNTEPNIFHISAKFKRVKFFREAMNLLAPKTKLQLLACKDEVGWNPLHYLASHKWFNLELVQCTVSFYKSLVHHQGSLSSSSSVQHCSKPWLAYADNNKQTPLHLALKTEDKGHSKLQINEDCALEILSLDIDSFCSEFEFEEQSLLCFAVRLGLSRLALKILTSSSSYKVHGEEGFTPLHYAPRCSEKVLELLLDKHEEMIDVASRRDRYCVLHKWALLDIPFSMVVLQNCKQGIKTKLFVEAIYRPDRRGSNALHLAAANPDTDKIARNLIQGHQDAEITHNKTPWTERDGYGDTPLHCALSSKNQGLASYILSLDTTLYDVKNNAGESPLYVAVANGCDQFVEEVLNKGYPTRYRILHRYDDITVLHNLYKLTEETGTKLLKKYWWIMDSRDYRGVTALDEAIKYNVLWLVRLLKDPSLLDTEDFDWAEACKNNETPAVLKFIDNCQDLVRICHEKKDTPLHHITLPNRQQYLDLLRKPSIDEIKNLPDSNGDTPLHKALKREDIELAKALLSDDEVLKDFKNNDDKTARNILKKLYKQHEHWKTMCKQVDVDPSPNTGYITGDTDLGEMRTTLSVIAALLATITFAAAFTLPGGFNDTTGEAILAKKAAFIAFLISDTYAMCTSMLVLFLLIWSMASSLSMSRVLVDRSVFILMQALYGTMAAFMTGIYLIMAHSSTWTTIVIFIMCSFTGILITMIQLHRLAKLIPAMAKKYKKDKEESLKSLEEGNNDSQKRE